MNPVRHSGENKARLLITGAGGLLGHAVCAAARSRWSVLALYRRHRPQVADITAISIDLTETRTAADLVRRLRPQALVHLAAASRVSECQAHPESSRGVNVDATAMLADICAELKIDLLFSSTDLVFDGRQGPYDEDAAPNPVCIYGAQKRLAEKEVLRRHPRALVCRLPLLFGPARPTDDNFAVEMVSAIHCGRPLRLFVDEFRTPVDTQSAARGLLQMLGRTRGIMHLGGRTRLSRFELGLLMAECMQVVPHMIRPVRIADLTLSASRAPDCALDSRRAYQLGYAPTPLNTAVQQFVNQVIQQKNRM